MTTVLVVIDFTLIALLVIGVWLGILAGRDLDQLRTKVVTLEREAGDAAGEVKGLKAAIEQAGLGVQLAAAKAEVVKLQADVDRMRFDQRAALERAQDAAKMVALPSPYYPRNGG